MLKQFALGAIFMGAASLLGLNAPLHAALQTPIKPSYQYNWYYNNTALNTAYALGVSHWNFLKYYDEARLRYGELPSADQLADATVGWDIYIGSNVPGLNKLMPVDNNPPDRLGLWTASTPLIPLINNIVTPVNKTEGFRRPLLPPLKFTRDGRIGLAPESGGLDGKPQLLRIRLNRPESLKKHFLQTEPGVPTLDPETWAVADYSKWGLPGAKLTQFVSICEGLPKSSSEANPYACGDGGQDDCYSMTLVGGGVTDTFTTSDIYELEGGYRVKYMPQLDTQDRVYSREMTVRVSQPKTAQARIASVEFSPDYRVSPIRQGVLFELNTPADGRLLVTRRQGLPLVWRHSKTGQMRAGSYEIVYAVAPEDAEPCDASQWGDFQPISHAPYDSRVNKKYPFAKYPFRDPMGNYIPDGEDLKATYPWLDMDAKNMSVMISDANLFSGGFHGQSSRFKSSCVNPGCKPSDSQEKSNISQFTMMGAWTRGKMAIIDNKINYSDFRINLANAVYLDLYQPGSASAVTENRASNVEVGAYREVGGGTIRDQYIPLKDEYGRSVLGRDGSPQKYLMRLTSLFDSIENRMNYNPHMKPAMPFDVVWLLSSGATSDEFAFDDLLNDNAFIISDMVAAYSWVNLNRFRMTGFDGWNEQLGSWRGQVKVQNSATTLPQQWVVPKAGDVVSGRIEPVANGGVKGKGMYFNGIDTRILYNISGTQPKPMSSSYWFHSVFLDARGLTKGAEQVVIDFPDKSRLTISDAGQQILLNAYNNLGQLVKAVPVPAGLVRDRWFQLGLQKSPSNLVTLFVNGYPYADFAPANGSLFQMTGGALVLGRPHNSYGNSLSSWQAMLGLSNGSTTNHRAFKGWMDEYKVYAYKPDLETACNLAHGTLVAVGKNAQMARLASLYPAQMHSRVSTALQLRGQSSFPSYACFQDNPSKGQTAVLHKLPPASISVRSNMHFPEGPLYHDAPRPDSTKNEFCLACHSSSNFNGLTVEALRYKNIPAKLDPRRQPTQAPQFITGHIPADFISTIKGNWNAMGSQFMDEYLMPSSNGVVPTIRNLVQVQSGRPIAVVTSGATISRRSFSALRVNVSGLASRAVFRINGRQLVEDSLPPFELPVNFLVNGTNTVSITTSAPNRRQSSSNFQFKITP